MSFSLRFSRVRFSGDRRSTNTLWLEIAVEVFHHHGFGTQHVFVDVGHAQAAFVVVLHLAFGLHNFGIYHGAFYWVADVFFLFLVVFAIAHHHQPYGQVYLRGGKADAVCGVHGFKHIVDKLLKVRIIGVNRLGGFS